MANIVPVTISDALFYKTDPVFQYNEGDQLLVISGITLPASYRVDFSNHIDNYMAYTVTGDADGAVIPPEILANGNTIYAFYVDESGDTVTTQYRIEIPVIRRPMPEDYVPSPSSHGIINQLTQDVGDLKSDLGDLSDLDTTDKSSLVDAINEVYQSGGGGSALTQDTKQALLQCFAHTAWTDAHGQDYYDDLEDALYHFDLLSTISAVYTQSGTVYDTDSLDSLKADLVVTGTYSDGTYNTIRNYTLSGTLTAGTSTITVTYGGKTATFTVTVTQGEATLTSISAVYTQSGTVYDNDSLDSLKTDLAVTAHYSDNTTATVPSANYTLSGTLAVGTSTVTVTYSGKTTTFNVTVTAHSSGKSDMDGWTDGVAYTDLEIVQDEYCVSDTGAIAAYNGWDRTGYVPCHGATSITVPPMPQEGSSEARSNNFFDENHNRVGRYMLMSRTQSTTHQVPTGAYYFMLSSDRAALASCLNAGVVPNA